MTRQGVVPVCWTHHVGPTNHACQTAACGVYSKWLTRGQHRQVVGLTFWHEVWKPTQTCFVAFSTALMHYHARMDRCRSIFARLAWKRPLTAQHWGFLEIDPLTFTYDVEFQSLCSVIVIHTHATLKSGSFVYEVIINKQTDRRMDRTTDRTSHFTVPANLLNNKWWWVKHGARYLTLRFVTEECLAMCVHVFSWDVWGGWGLRRDWSVWSVWSSTTSHRDADGT